MFSGRNFRAIQGLSSPDVMALSRNVWMSTGADQFIMIPPFRVFCCNRTSTAFAPRFHAVDRCQSPVFMQLRSLSVYKGLGPDALGASSTTNANPMPSSNKNNGVSTATPTDASDPIEKVDLRVGLVASVERHPDADTLYVLSVDLGESDLVDRSKGTVKRTIVSGLVKYYSSEELVGKGIVVFANMKPRKLRGIVSQGMLLAASKQENDTLTVEVLEAPEGSCPGDRVIACASGQNDKGPLVCGTSETNASAKPLIKKQKTIEAFIQGLELDKRTAKYRGRDLVSENGNSVSTKNMVSGTIG